MATNASDPRPYLLVVEDERDLSRILREHFVSEGFHVVTVDNGSEALRRVMVADYDAVVCDMVMPHMAGDMFYLAVKKVKPLLCERFVFITGHGESPQVREFLTSLGERVISKPFNIEDLSEAVRACVKLAEERRAQPPPSAPVESTDEDSS